MTTTAHSREHNQILQELDGIPRERLPKLAEMIRSFRESFALPSTGEGLGRAARRGAAHSVHGPRLSEEEITELMSVQPLTGAEIVRAGLTGSWADEGIADGGAWVEEKRHERRMRRSW